MDLTTCMQCGVVLNRDFLEFPSARFLEDDDGYYPSDCFEYRDGEFMPFIHCPVCEGRIYGQPE